MSMYKQRRMRFPVLRRFFVQKTGSVGLILAIVLPVPLSAEGVGLGQPVDEASLLAMDITILPDGTNLPAGSGSVEAGSVVYEQKCASCHGADGAGGDGMADPLVGGVGSLSSDAPMKTVGSYWPYATTLFDYIRRAMPLDAPLSLSDADVYALSAFILSKNGIVGEDAVMDADTLTAVKMPNRDGFESQWPEHTH